MLYKDFKKPVADRVKDLMTRMSIEEKAMQMTSVWAYDVTNRNFDYDHEKIAKNFPSGLGQITRLGGSTPTLVQDLPQFYNQIQRYFVEETPLGIPVMFHEESCSGAMFHGSTNFPQAIGMAATFNTDLCYQIGQIIGKELRYAGAHQTLAPLLDVTREPRWGRMEETFGEDPYLVAQMGIAYIRGVQENGVLATGKHFVAYGAAEKGFNWAPGQVPERTMREIYLYPFEAAIKEANLGSIMPAYQENDGEPCHSSHHLLKKILRDEWGFEGLVVTDYSGLTLLESFHKLFPNYESIAKRAVECEIDIELPTQAIYGKILAQEVARKNVDEMLFNKIVARILTKKFELGLFENPYIIEKPVTDLRTSKSIGLSLQAAKESIILLKNKGVLPLNKQAKIALIGPNADSIRNQLGDYAYAAHIDVLMEAFVSASQGNSHGSTFTNTVSGDADCSKLEKFVKVSAGVSVLQGLKNKGLNISYAEGCGLMESDPAKKKAALDCAKNSDIIVAVMGDRAGLTEHDTSGESRDRVGLDIFPAQQDLLKDLYALGKPIVLVFIHGRPLASPWAKENMDAILYAWFPGEQGGAAIADILTGDYCPGGKLPLTVPQTVGQLPIYYNHKPSGGAKRMWGGYVDGPQEPLYPFGFGLSYTQFKISNLRSNKTQLQCGEELILTCDVSNIGAVAGEEVVQIYFGNNALGVTRPVRELKAFKRVLVNPGETKTVEFRININILGYYDEDMIFSLKPAKVNVTAANHSEDSSCELVLNITNSQQITKKIFSTTAFIH